MAEEHKSQQELENAGGLGSLASKAAKNFGVVGSVLSVGSAMKDFAKAKTWQEKVAVIADLATNFGLDALEPILPGIGTVINVAYGFGGDTMVRKAVTSMLGGEYTLDQEDQDEVNQVLAEAQNIENLPEDQKAQAQANWAGQNIDLSTLGDISVTFQPGIESVLETAEEIKSQPEVTQPKQDIHELADVTKNKNTAFKLSSARPTYEKYTTVAGQGRKKKASIRKPAPKKTVPKKPAKKADTSYVGYYRSGKKKSIR